MLERDVNGLSILIKSFFDITLPQYYVGRSGTPNVVTGKLPWAVSISQRLNAEYK